MSSSPRAVERLRIPTEFLERSDLWGARACLRLFGVPLVLIAALPTLADISAWLAVATVVPLGIAISKTTLLVHEAVHGTLFRASWLNALAGRVGGMLTLVDFASFERLHRHHHARVGALDDPQILDYGALEGASRWRLAWHLLRPLLGWNVLHMATLVRERIRLRRSWPLTLAELAGLCVVQAGLALLASNGGQLPWLALVFPVAASTVGLFMSQIRGFCEHVPMPGESGDWRLRSHESHAVERPFLHHLNYNNHGEHHRFPHVPSRNLLAHSRWLGEQGIAVERAPSYTATLLARWRAAQPT